MTPKHDTGGMLDAAYGYVDRIDSERVRSTLTPARMLDYNGIQYQRRGDELRTRQCPTCGQRTRDSVAINARTGAWSCHAHGCKGGIFALVAGYAGLDVVRHYPHVVELGARIAGFSVDGGWCRDFDRKLAERCRADAARGARIDSERKAALATMPARWEALHRRSFIGESYLEKHGNDPAELRHRGDVVRYSPSGDPAVALRDLATGAIVGIQYRCLGGDRKPTSEKGSRVAGSALLGRVADIDPDGVDVAILVEGLADTFAHASRSRDARCTGRLAGLNSKQCPQLLRREWCPLVAGCL
jgi:hypothetical protein